ncbi:hypothetical protein F5972_35790 [Microbispora cellulosiformans]|uniref:DUF6917 domain-containing protein n=1 Tax=Microbispora cellulosiformans TaxID=2614688 RepID=A0A5J5JTR2_9ACTN|nr:hypothetical protein [Microbispora cellulosiformans]KAA9373290.1 hypothetical protein F5972_35790 [Microbispora cellulosiformans]
MYDESGAKRSVQSELVKVLKHHRDDRGMVLEPFGSRCVRRGEIHELVTTDEAAAMGDRVDRVGFLGFTEITSAGVLDVGDTVVVDGRPIGRLLGFDACHFPNHYNLLISTPRLLTGPGLGLSPGSVIVFSASAGGTAHG